MPSCVTFAIEPPFFCVQPCIQSDVPSDRLMSHATSTADPDLLRILDLPVMNVVHDQLDKGSRAIFGHLVHKCGHSWVWLFPGCRIGSQKMTFVCGL